MMMRWAAWVRNLTVVTMLVGFALPGSPGLESAAAQGQGTGGRTVDEIVAVVGDTPILRSEVEQQVQLLAEQLQVDPADSAAYNRLHREILDGQINDLLLVMEAEAQEFRVEPEEIGREVETAIQGNIRTLGGRANFDEQLRLEGLTEMELRERYQEEARKKIMASRLLQKEVRPKVSVDEEMARRFFQENRAQIPPKPRQLRIQDLYVRTRPDSVVERRAEERAGEVRQKIVQEGIVFEEAARRFSDDPRGKEGGPLGRFERGELEPELEEIAFNLPRGEVSRPVATGFGYHLIQVVERDPDGEWVELRHVLLAATPSRSDEVQAEDRARDILDRIQGGELSFADAIEQYSDAPSAAQNAGDLGWIPIDNFYGEMREVVDTLRVGRIAGPVAGDGGYHIFKVLGEQAEGSYAFEEISGEMRQLAAQAAMDQEIDTYLEELRKKYFVEVRVAW